MNAPKLSISYSWSNPLHEQWVLDLATELHESGVDVILDKWDLREGHDALSFMEKMVTDPDIKKVAIVCDQTYAEKADGRAGGVGTETQIISKEVYENQAQDKFVAVVSEKSPEGRPFLPTYYKSRIYIDLSEPDNYGENFERLLRWVFDKPLYVKPELGSRPSFLAEGETISLGTTATFKRAYDAIKDDKTYGVGSLDEYLNTFVENLERFRIDNPEGEFDDAVMKSIEDFIPYRNEAIQLFIAISRYSAKDEYLQRLHRFFENLLPYTARPTHITSRKESDFDNFKFIVHELFLYAIAILIKYERFAQANYLLQQRYYLPMNTDYGQDAMVNFTAFSNHLESLEYRNRRLTLKRVSLRADLLKNRCSGIGLEFSNLMQADFVLFLRSDIEANDNQKRWRPMTLVYLGHFNQRPFEIFARSMSKSYFDQVKCLLSIGSAQNLEPLLTSYNEGTKPIPKWGFDSIRPSALLGYEQLETIP